MIKEIEYLGMPGCLELTNGDARLVIPTEFGPRILFYGLDEGENVFGWHPEAAVETELGTWRPYGGHRLWAAPENMPLSYAPDNDPVEHRAGGDLSITVAGTPDPTRGLQKELTVTLAEKGSDITVDHRITNRGQAAVEISAWALSIMRSGGEAVVPNEPFAPYSGDNLLPVRSMALWSYTDLTDPRWKISQNAIRLRCDDRYDSQQKFGVLNKQGWVAYGLHDVKFVKRFDYMDGVSYPDLNSNTEIYTAGGFIEVETVSPLKMVPPGASVEYQERWKLASK
jgi:hypothetical protein